MHNLIDSTQESWKDIPGFEDYQISSTGLIKSKARTVTAIRLGKHQVLRELPEKLLPTRINRTSGNYVHVNLYRNKRKFSKSLHRLVAETFLPPTGIPHAEVNHIDGNKLNNDVSNLEWCSRQENSYHATIMGLKARGERVGASKLNDHCVYAIKHFLKQGMTQKELAEIFRIDASQIARISTGERWKHIA